MGADQSSISEENGGCFQPIAAASALDSGSPPSSLPSPTTAAFSRRKSRFLFSNLPRSLSTSLHGSTQSAEGSLPFNAPSESFGLQHSILSRLTSNSTTTLATDTVQGPIDGTRHADQQKPRGGGIVIVNPGRTRAHSYCDISNLSDHEGLTRKSDYLYRQLRRLPTVEPLFPTSTANLTSLLRLPHGEARFVDSTDKSAALFHHKIDAKELIEITKCYEDYLRQTAAKVNQRQSEIVGLQNKVDYGVRHLVEALSARSKGISPQCDHRLNSKKPTHSTSLSDANNPATGYQQHRLAGARQVDDVVLLTSQISSLLSQCTAMAQDVQQTIDTLDAGLPESLYLPPPDADPNKPEN